MQNIAEVPAQQGSCKSFWSYALSVIQYAWPYLLIIGGAFLIIPICFDLDGADKIHELLEDKDLIPVDPNAPTPQETAAIRAACVEAGIDPDAGINLSTSLVSTTGTWMSAVGLFTLIRRRCENEDVDSGIFKKDNRILYLFAFGVFLLFMTGSAFMGRGIHAERVHGVGVTYCIFALGSLGAAVYMFFQFDCRSNAWEGYFPAEKTQPEQPKPRLNPQHSQHVSFTDQLAGNELSIPEDSGDSATSFTVPSKEISGELKRTHPFDELSEHVSVVQDVLILEPKIEVEEKAYKPILLPSQIVTQRKGEKVVKPKHS